MFKRERVVIAAVLFTFSNTTIFVINNDFNLIQVFFTEERKDVEDYLEGIGADYEWENDGSLTFGYTRPASVQYPVTGVYSAR